MPNLHVAINTTLNPQPVELPEWTPSEQKSTGDERTTDLVIPAGAYYVSVKNTDKTPGSKITINGEDRSYGGEWNGEVKVNQPMRIQDFVEEVSITSNGFKYWFKVSYPSTSAVNPATL